MAMEQKTSNIVNPYNAQQDLANKYCATYHRHLSKIPLEYSEVARLLRVTRPCGLPLLAQKTMHYQEIARLGISHLSLTSWQENWHAVSAENADIYSVYNGNLARLDIWFPELCYSWGIPNPAKWQPKLGHWYSHTYGVATSTKISPKLTVRFAAN